MRAGNHRKATAGYRTTFTFTVKFIVGFPFRKQQLSNKDEITLIIF